MKKFSLAILIGLLSFSLHSSGQEAKNSEPKYEMKVYQMVFLKKGPNRTQDSVSAAKIQEGHLAHLDKLAKEGKLVMAGPFMDKGDIRGICVYDVKEPEEVLRLANEDPAIKSGRLIAEIHPWYAARGSKLP